MRFIVTFVAALSLSTAVWAQGNCPRGSGQGRCGQGQRQCQCQGQREGRGQCDPATCTNPNCPKKQGGNTGSQQGNPKR
jgi:hypothetical protein